MRYAPKPATQYGVLFCTTLLWLVGCESSGEGTISRSDVTATTASINAFDITGTSTPLLPISPPPIDANENNGDFSIRYDISANGSVDIELSVVTDNNQGFGAFFCGDEASEFYDRDCGGDENCGLSDTLQCNFNTENIIRCNNGKEADLTPYLTELPMRANIALCVNHLDGDSRASHEVEFR